MVLRRILLSVSVCVLFFTNAHAINLGGTEVSKDKFIVYLLIGHSQMAGIITTNNDNVTDPHAWVYRWQSTKTWELAKETGSTKNGLSGRGTGGPGMPFLKLMISRHSGYYFGIVSNADPAATCHGLNTGSNGSALSDSANRYWRDAQLFHEIVDAGRAIKNNVTLGGVMVMLGTVEATRADSIDVCQQFSKDIAQMATDIRDSLGMPNLPFVVADYEKGASATFSVSNPWPAIIAKQLDSVPLKVSNSVLVNSKAIPMFDDHHFSITGE
ncbi:MAG TPA: sialate O-acetylesterase, partial [Chitinivibrionales bacterium]